MPREPGSLVPRHPYTAATSIQENEEPMRTFCKAAPLALFIAVAAPAGGQVVNEDIKLLAGDGAAYDRFGHSISIDNGVVAVGALYHEENGLDSGAAYLFDASTGVQIAELLPNDAAADDRFGFSIAIDNGVVAVGARLDDDNGSESGSAYLFSASPGVQIGKLLPTDGAAGDHFGFSIAIDNGIVAVGAAESGGYSGSAYLFDASTGDQIHELLPIGGVGSPYFGCSIAIHNGVVAVGARSDRELDGNHPYVPGSGAAYLFNASTGAQIAKLLPSDGARGDQFGHSIAIDNGVVAVAALFGDGVVGDSGAVYLFDASTGAQIAKLFPTDGVSNDNFGSSIAIDNGVVAIGAFYDNSNGFSSGSAYLFNASSGSQIAKLLASDALYLELLGQSIAIDNGVVVAGAPDNSDRPGAAYIFEIGVPCSADLDGDGTVSASDLAQLLGSWGPNPGAPADFDGDGTVGAADLAQLLGAWGPC